VTDPLLGAVLEGRYRIRGRIAHGGMATVYHALDERLERTVAVKVMHPSYAADPSFLERFTREAKSIARLNHPNVVGVYDQGSHDGLAYLVMEYVRGRTLRDLLVEHGRLSPAEAMAVLDPLVSALAAAHRAGLVHRDVKPENVLLGDDGEIKVADFGLARAAESAGRSAATGTLMGTVSYVAPELVTHGAGDTRTDVYAAGIVLFEMLTGTVPFRGETAMSVAYQHVHADVPPPSELVAGIPEPLDALVLRATRREPGARPADGGAFLAELRDVRSDLALPPVALAGRPRAVQRVQPTIAVPREELLQTSGGGVGAVPGPGPRHGGGDRRGALAALAVLVVLGLVAAGTGWWFGAGRYTETPALLNLSKAAAEQKAREQGLRVEYRDERYDETVAKGLVLDQEPDPHGRILRDGTVTLTISRGKDRVAVPSLVGKTRPDAEAQLRARSLTPQVREEYDEKVPAGRVVSTTPAAGSALKRRTVVTVLVSRGPPLVELPDQRNRTKDEAVADLGGRGFDVVFVEEHDAEVEAGRVIGSDPGPGQVPKGSRVTLKISKGPEIVAVPDVKGKSFDEAKAILEGAGLGIQKVFDLPLGGDDKVGIQQPGAGENVPKGTTVNVWVN